MAIYRVFILEQLHASFNDKLDALNCIKNLKRTWCNRTKEPFFAEPYTRRMPKITMQEIDLQNRINKWSN